jgi:hypothetical protein
MGKHTEKASPDDWLAEPFAGGPSLRIFSLSYPSFKRLSGFSILS